MPASSLEHLPGEEEDEERRTKSCCCPFLSEALRNIRHHAVRSMLAEALKEPPNTYNGLSAGLKGSSRLFLYDTRRAVANSPFRNDTKTLLLMTFHFQWLPSMEKATIALVDGHDGEEMMLQRFLHFVMALAPRLHLLSTVVLVPVHRTHTSLPSKETLRGHSDSSFRGEGYIQCCVGVRLCDMYSNQELAEIHFMYGKADGNAALARRLYQQRYPQRQCPDRKTFVRLHYRLCEYGKFNSPGLERGRPDLQLQKYRRRFWRL
ncbi:hypothetical protein ANN_27220 [Periplaneta americana]|uniref:DUF4817 domain-containing protein n=1 Tax=Periplaneta americana TaxID=6978 RepID=A0ABQ8RXK0_PERAM|nr:hypothetical protein ANN_27220 [Periplaneta americana]